MVAVCDSEVMSSERPAAFREVPRTAELALRTGKGKPRKRKLEVVEGACEYTMAAAFRSFDYSISAGDAETGWHTVEVISSPRVAKTQIRLVYPDYMDRAPDTMEAMTLTVPEGARIEWNLQLDRPVSHAAFTIRDIGRRRRRGHYGTASAGHRAGGALS